MGKPLFKIGDVYADDIKEQSSAARRGDTQRRNKIP